MSTDDARRKGSIFYIGAAEKFPPELEGCIVREIDESRFVRITQKKDLLQKGQRAEYARRLFLIDEDFSAERKEAIACLRRSFPEANLCMLINDEVTFPNIIREYFQEDLIKSVLPMNLRIDIWLGAVRLLLNGGHYLPADAIKYMGQPSAPERATLKSVKRPGFKRQPTRFKTLTKRETEVLHLISDGFQNKNIAEKLSLSEHTIKLHIHHIISKLGVSNRTEAAAIYLQADRGHTIREN